MSAFAPPNWSKTPPKKAVKLDYTVLSGYLKDRPKERFGGHAVSVSGQGASESVGAHVKDDAHSGGLRGLTWKQLQVQGM